MSAREALPLHYVRPMPQGRRGRPQSPARKAVEAELRHATHDVPLSAEQIAARTQLAASDVRMHISNICARGWAYRITRTTFAWGTDPGLAARARSSESRGAGTYDGRELRPYTGRPGAMDAFALPSLQNGQRVPRKAPIIVAATGGMRMASRGPSGREE